MAGWRFSFSAFISVFLATALGSFSRYSFSDVLSSYRNPHPLGWMHQLPVGEAPGWTSSFWMQFDVSHANIWGRPLTMINTRNGKTLEYFADFEESSGVLEIGSAHNEWLAFALELPYSIRSGGFLDQFIDTFHLVVGARRMDRPEFPMNENHFDIKTDGVDRMDPGVNAGGGSFKIKTKIWWLKSLGESPESCPCGLATSLQVKVPTEASGRAFSSGTPDFSLLLHLGVPLFSTGALWLTAATTQLGANPLLTDWPVFRSQQMFELAFDIPLGDGWGLLLQGRAESPFLDSAALRIVDSAATQSERDQNRIASGWNSLVRWRGSQAFGFRYHTSSFGQWNLLMIEDWGIGPFDQRGDQIYVTNAPDVGFLLQYRLGI